MDGAGVGINSRADFVTNRRILHINAPLGQRVCYLD